MIFSTLSNSTILVWLLLYRILTGRYKEALQSLPFHLIHGCKSNVSDSLLFERRRWRSHSRCTRSPLLMADWLSTWAGETLLTTWLDQILWMVSSTLIKSSSMTRSSQLSSSAPSDMVERYIENIKMALAYKATKATKAFKSKEKIRSQLPCLHLCHRMMRLLVWVSRRSWFLMNSSCFLLAERVHQQDCRRDCSASWANTPSPSTSPSLTTLPPLSLFNHQVLTNQSSVLNNHWPITEEEAGEPCGVEYFIRAVMIDSKDGVEADRTGVNMAIRKIQFAPTRQGRQPSTTVRKVKVKQFCNDLIKYFC